MFPLAHLLDNQNSAFRTYVANKTGYLLTGKSTDQLIYFWVHLIKNLSVAEILETLSDDEKKFIHKIFLNFGYLSASQVEDTDLEIEKKITWIFRHPAGGLFIPLEIIKTLMTGKSLTGDTYLFHHFARLKYSEQQGLAVFIHASSGDKSNLLTIERSPKDMALVLYIWFSNLHAGGFARYPYRGKLLNSPYSFLRESDKRTNLHPEAFPEKPVSLWRHLKLFFPHLNRDIHEFQEVLLSSGKGFYRSLQMLKNPKNEIAEAFRQGYLMPVFPRGALNEKNIQKLMVVTSPELRNSILNTKMSETGKVRNSNGN
ncbi:MAG: hypothetical protein KDK38_02795 [Leptospiraceae bacterium]|nr:hypothetical protein [Leptospiraceae bacterium]